MSESKVICSNLGMGLNGCNTNNGVGHIVLESFIKQTNKQTDIKLKSICYRIQNKSR